jgi:hypothetical protein
MRTTSTTTTSVTRERPGRGTRLRTAAAAGAMGAVLLLCGATASADEYEPSNAGHPLRVAAYIVHPVGVVYDYLLLRPAFWVGSHDPFRTLFGRTD